MIACTICNTRTRVALLEEYGATVAYCRDCIPVEEQQLLEEN